jgi:hypothetical protein
MITPTTITNYNRTEEELEEFLLFSILVAGKGAEQQAKKLDAFLAFIKKHNFGKTHLNAFSNVLVTNWSTA